MRATRIIGGLSVLVLVGAIAWDLADDGFWSRHTLFTSLVASLIVVAVTAAVLNEVLDRRQRERWSVLAQYALFDFVRTARLVWSGLLELAGLVPDGELGDGALAAGSYTLQWDMAEEGVNYFSNFGNPTASFRIFVASAPTPQSPSDQTAIVNADRTTLAATLNAQSSATSASIHRFIVSPSKNFDAALTVSPNSLHEWPAAPETP